MPTMNRTSPQSNELAFMAFLALTFIPCLAIESRADVAIVPSAPKVDVPAIACVEPIRKVKADYIDYRDGRLELSKRFLRHQLWALEKLQKRIKILASSVRGLMGVARAAATDAEKQANLHSVSILLQDELDQAKRRYDDLKKTDDDAIVWVVTMDTQIILKNGDYGVSACSVATNAYDRRITMMLRTCSILDVETGTIWGRTPEDSLEIAGNKMDEGRFMAFELSRDFPMCLGWAGFRQFSGRVASDLADAKQNASPLDLRRLEENFLAPPWGLKDHNAPFDQRQAQ